MMQFPSGWREYPGRAVFAWRHIERLQKLLVRVLASRARYARRNANQAGTIATLRRALDANGDPTSSRAWQRLSIIRQRRYERILRRVLASRRRALQVVARLEERSEAAQAEIHYLMRENTMYTQMIVDLERRLASGQQQQQQQQQQQRQTPEAGE